nr:hypothetical protein [Tanacetum cinerariifolium]
MVNLEFCDTHNMISYLKKPEGSEEFHQIGDFINAVTYESTATIDGKVKIVTKASVRRHLQLADSDGISSLPTIKIFEQLSLIGAQLFRVKNQHTQLSPITHLSPKSPTQSLVADEVASIGVDVRFGGATTTVIGLEVGQGSGNIDNTPTMPYDLPLSRVNTLGNDQGSMTQQELKKTAKFRQARRRARIVVSDDEDDLEDPSEQWRKITKIDQDPGILLVQHDAKIHGRYGHDMEFDYDFDTAEKYVSTAELVSTGGAAVTTDSVTNSTASPTRNTRVSTADDITMAETLMYIRKSVAKEKAVRLQVELDEEERQRIARVLESSNSINVKEWEDIQARVKADEEDDLVMLWSLVKEKLNSIEPTNDKVREIWVELKRLFKQDIDDELWKFQKHIHDLTYRLYDSCGVHHVSTKKGIDIYMLVEKEYPLTRGTLIMMLVTKLLVDEDNEMSRKFLRKKFMQAERPKR